MEWNLDKNRPIHPQICEQLCVGIASGELMPGERLLSVREVAMAAKVNPNTVQKAFEDLGHQEIIYSIRGSGWYVSENTDAAKQMVETLKADKAKAYFSAMAALGVNQQNAKQFIEEWNV